MYVRTRFTTLWRWRAAVVAAGPIITYANPPPKKQTRTLPAARQPRPAPITAVKRKNSQNSTNFFFFFFFFFLARAPSLLSIHPSLSVARRARNAHTKPVSTCHGAGPSARTSLSSRYPHCLCPHHICPFVCPSRPPARLSVCLSAPPGPLCSAGAPTRQVRLG